MATEQGRAFDFRKVYLRIGLGFEVDAFADGGFDVTWNGDVWTVATGADGINMLIKVNNTAATLTANMQQSAKFLDYASAWLSVGDVRSMSFIDTNGSTFMTSSRTVPRQNPNMTFNNAHNPRAIDLICASLVGVSGSVS
jgi:hypothetical protein